MKKFLFIPLLAALCSCGGGESKPVTDEAKPAETTTSETPAATDNAATTDSKGLGKFSNIELGALDEAKATEGKKIADMKCASCHRMDDKKLVGPGWKGVTERRKPEWIMNFVTNVDENLNKDPQAMSLLEECLVRMPNQNLTDADARNILEYMRKNDGVK